MKYKIIALLTAFLSILVANFSASSSQVKVEAKQQLKVGIDVSYHQGEIDWKGVKESGVDFVMLRIGYDFSLDKKFENYLMGAKSVGLDIGAYFYSYADNVQDAIAEAENCVKWLDKYPATFTYPIVYDAEEKKMEKFAAKACEAFCEVLKSNGYYAMIYASTNWFNSVIAPLSSVSHIEFWQANYYSAYANKTPIELLLKASNRPKINSYDSNVTMWQCTDSGKVNGIKGGVDVNISYVDFAKIITEEGYNGFHPNKENKRVAVCNQSYVNLRSAPTTASAVIGRVNLGDNILLKRRANSRWLEVEIESKTGYLYADYFTIKAYQESNGDNNFDKGENQEIIPNNPSNDNGETDDLDKNPIPNEGEESFNSGENSNGNQSGCASVVKGDLAVLVFAVALIMLIKNKSK